MSDFDIDEFLSEADAECDVELKGKTLTFEVESPGHTAFLELQRAAVNLDAKIEESEGGEIPYSADDVSTHYQTVDDHILRLEGNDWQDMPQQKRQKLLHKLHAKEFWKLVNTIASAGRLEDDEGND